jgi:hypothetical protein
VYQPKLIASRVHDVSSATVQSRLVSLFDLERIRSLTFLWFVKNQVLECVLKLQRE